MTKGRSKKYRAREPPTSQPANHSNVKKIKERYLKKKKKQEKNVDPATISGLSSFGPTQYGPHVGSTTSSTLALPPASGTNTHEQRRNKEKGMKEKQRKGCKDEVFGFIFMCNGRTKPECYKHRVFGLPEGKLEVVKKIRRGIKLFLFDTDLKLLYGVYKATTRGKVGLEPFAFNGRFPAQVRFKVYKDCLPIPESAFRHAIKDNYHGSKFSQALCRKQVKSLLSLFCPVTFPTSAVASTVQNVSTPPSFSIPLVEGFQHPETYPPPVDSYVTGAPYKHFRSRQVIPHSLYDPYEPEVQEANTQPSREPQQIIEQAGFPCHVGIYSVTETHAEYLPEKPSFTAQDLHQRYGIVPDVIPRDRVTAYGTEYHTPQLPKERVIASHSEHLAPNYNQHPPHIAASHSSHILTPSYALQPSHPQGGLQYGYQSYNAVARHGGTSQVYSDPLTRTVPGSSSLVETNLPVPSRFHFAGAAPSFR